MHLEEHTVLENAVKLDHTGLINLGLQAAARESTHQGPCSALRSIWS